jgi:hypothetical protein
MLPNQPRIRAGSLSKGEHMMRVMHFGPVWQANRRERVQRRRASWLACLTVLAAALLGCVLPHAASAESGSSSGIGTSTELGASAEPEEISLTPSTTKPYYGCPHAGCAVIDEPPAIKTSTGYALPDGTPLVGGGPEGGYTPEELELAYNIPKAGGKEPEQQTVAVIDAWGDKTAESDLEKYREYEQYKLGPCTKSSGCFKKVNQEGKEENYPEAKTTEAKEREREWGRETSLDLDMVSAACRECHILLVEANNEEESEMGAATNKAVELGATEVSSSYIFPETYKLRCGEADCTQYASDYNHPGIPIMVAAGDYGYDNSYYFAELTKPAPTFPASTPTVIAVGGTALTIEKKARSSETVWSRSGSGCSASEPKTNTWQKETEETESRKGCASGRTDNDVAADASCATPVSFYSTPYYDGWSYACGTSVAAPFVAGIEAHATSATRLLGADAFYKKPAMLFHVTEGSNGECGTESEATWYLCHATKENYNGPTGMGTPNGVFTSTAPAAATGSATNIESKGATLNGIVNPNGVTTKYYLEYGTTMSYDTKTAEVSAGSGTTNVKESTAIAGLTSSTTYHFRVVATSSNGTTDGLDQTFTTAPPPSWSIQETPNPKESTGNGANLEGISCTSSTVCTAVGHFEKTGGKWVPLAESWNGTAWTVQEPPYPTTSYSYIDAVSCTSSKACTAVGYFTNSEKQGLPLAEQWNGTAWTMQEPPVPSGRTSTALKGVSCVSAEDCVAVGWSNEHTLVERWNGKEWSVQEPPAPTGAKASYLQSVSCTSSEACIAGGAFYNSAGKFMPLAERWNGTAWSVQEPPSPTGAKENWLQSVSCVSSAVCTAAGYFYNSAGEDMPLAERWNGATWTVQEPPSPKGITKKSFIYLELRGVSCTSSTECIAVGYFNDGSGPESWAPLAESWNGTAWTVQEPPGPSGTTETHMFGVSCTGSITCLGAGHYNPSGPGATLAEIYH